MIAHKILIVDDEPDNIKAIRNCLAETDEPFTLYQALNGELATKIAFSELPDLIITDWEMPGMNGIELVKRLKQNDNTTDIPTIMCTGVMTSSENLQLALKAGAADYIRKPIDRIELIARVKSMLVLSDSKKKLKEEYLKIEQRNRFIHAVIESIPHPFVYYTVKGKINGYNKRFEKIGDLPQINLMGSDIYDHPLFKGDFIHRHNDSQLIKHQTATTYENKFSGLDYLYSKTLFYSSPKDTEGIFCILIDVTELKHYHAEIIESKKRELTSIALRLTQLSELNGNLIADLEKITEHTSATGTELIRQTIRKFTHRSDEKFWQEFESRFENVHETFYFKLNQFYPQLTSGEKKLCAFLRLNLSSKDIAAITFKDPQSVDMARYRLRKKLNLKQEEKLIDFLMNLA